MYVYVYVCGMGNIFCCQMESFVTCYKDLTSVHLNELQCYYHFSHSITEQFDHKFMRQVQLSQNYPTQGYASYFLFVECPFKIP